MKEKGKTFFSAGISSILLVFVLLCLVTFAALSLASADADLKLSKKVADRTTAYYAAESRANHVLRDIGQILNHNGRDDVFVQEQEDGIHITFTEEIDENEELAVELLVTDWDGEEEPLYKILRWQSGQRSEWTPDMSLPVMQ